MFTTPDQLPVPGYCDVTGIEAIPAEQFEACLAEPDISEDRRVPEYYLGDRMDWDLAVAALFPSPGAAAFSK